MTNAVSSELLKLGRRRMTWVMTLLLFGLSFVGFFLFLILTDEIPATLPTLIRDSYALVPVLGLLFGLVFGASSCGWEFASHTFPSVLAREPNRTVIWVAKLIVLAFDISGICSSRRHRRSSRSDSGVYYHFDCN